MKFRIGHFFVAFLILVAAALVFRPAHAQFGTGTTTCSTTGATAITDEQPSFVINLSAAFTYLTVLPPRPFVCAMMLIPTAIGPFGTKTMTSVTASSIDRTTGTARYTIAFPSGTNPNADSVMLLYYKTSDGRLWYVQTKTLGASGSIAAAETALASDLTSSLAVSDQSTYLKKITWQPTKLVYQQTFAESSKLSQLGIPTGTIQPRLAIARTVNGQQNLLGVVPAGSAIYDAIYADAASNTYQVSLVETPPSCTNPCTSASQQPNFSAMFGAYDPSASSAGIVTPPEQLFTTTLSVAAQPRVTSLTLSGNAFVSGYSKILYMAGTFTFDQIVIHDGWQIQGFPGFSLALTSRGSIDIDSGSGIDFQGAGGDSSAEPCAVSPTNTQQGLSNWIFASGGGGHGGAGGNGGNQWGGAANLCGGAKTESPNANPTRAGGTGLSSAMAQGSTSGVWPWPYLVVANSSCGYTCIAAVAELPGAPLISPRPLGTGGGVVSLTAATTITNAGTISANGASGQATSGMTYLNYPGIGAGAAGTIRLTAQTLVNTGTISAIGGGGEWAQPTYQCGYYNGNYYACTQSGGGGGGGGAIAIKGDYKPTATAASIDLGQGVASADNGKVVATKGSSGGFGSTDGNDGWIYHTLPPAPPTVTLAANPTAITAGQSSSLTWTSTNATICTAAGGWSGDKATGGAGTVSPITTTSYGITCTGPGGSASANTTITVGSAAGPPAITFAANPSAITAGQSSTLSWTVTNATSCTASGGWSGSKNPTGGTEGVSPPATTTYTLTCTGPGGTAAHSVTITVSSPINLAVIVTPISATVRVGGTQQFTATVTNNGISVTPVTLTWSVANPAAGTITQSGLFAAGSATGSYANVIQAVAMYGGQTATGRASVAIFLGIQVRGDVNGQTVSGLTLLDPKSIVAALSITNLLGERIDLPGYTLASSQDWAGFATQMRSTATRLIAEHERTLSANTMTGVFNLNPPPGASPTSTVTNDAANPEGSVWVHRGDLTIGAATFINRGTIIVLGGSLTIQGNLSYASLAQSNSLGIIVLDQNGQGGQAAVASAVTALVGSYYASGTFSFAGPTPTVSYFAGAIAASQVAFGPLDLIIQYDPRLVVTPPPGFTDVRPTQLQEGN